MWVGLPSQRGTKVSADSSYLNELYRSRAEKAGIVYVDIWDGFVDEAGRYSAQGPDYDGQTRRLRSADGVYFTKFGARKLAHYVEREIQRSITNRGVPVAFPVPVDPRCTGAGSHAAAGGGPGGVADRRECDSGGIGGRQRARESLRGRRNRLARLEQGRAGRGSKRAGRRFQLATRQCDQGTAARSRCGGRACGAGRRRSD
jgi:hypothetical protein